MIKCVKQEHCPFGLHHCCDICRMYDDCSYVCTDSNCEVRKAIEKKILTVFYKNEEIMRDKKMEFTAECGCKIEYPDFSLLSKLEGVEDFTPKVKYICEKHKYEFLVKYLEIFGEITFAQIKRVFEMPEHEVVLLLHKIESEHPENISITVHDYTVKRIN